MRLLAMALLTVLGQEEPGKAGLWEPVDAALRDLCDRYDKVLWLRWSPTTRPSAPRWTPRFWLTSNRKFQIARGMVKRWFSRDHNI